jgi:hypothetical protein
LATGASLSTSKAAEAFLAESKRRATAEVPKPYVALCTLNPSRNDPQKRIILFRIDDAKLVPDEDKQILQKGFFLLEDTVCDAINKICLDSPNNFDGVEPEVIEIDDISFLKIRRSNLKRKNLALAKFCFNYPYSSKSGQPLFSVKYEFF